MEAVDRSERHRAEHDGVVVARQPVIDIRGRVTGYRISYATVGLGGAGGIDDALALFDDVFSVVGLDELVGQHPAHLPVSGELLIALGVPPVRPDRVVLRVDHRDAVRDELVPILRSAAMRGYTLELDGIPGPDFDHGLLDLFAAIEIDLSRWAPDDVAIAVPAIVNRRALALAAGVRDHAERAAAQELGFEWFVGPFYTQPDVVAGRKVPVGDMATLVDVARLQNDSASLDDLIAVIDRDLGLTVRLLRYINSAYFGLANRVGSVRQAAALLGSRGVARWAMLVAVLSSAPKTSPELAVIALTRARMCERAAAGRPDVDADEMFTVGMLSMVDAVLGLPLEKVLAELPLTQPVADALLERGGPAGEILDAVIAYERGDFAAAALAPGLERISAAYRPALGWAREAVSSLGG
jgi:c-di-GMP phosphodiesterase